MKENKVFVDNLEIYYKETEVDNFCLKNKTILILHGWGSRSDNWKEVLEFFEKKNIKVFIPDLPGFGKSNKPPLAWTIEDYRCFVEGFVRQLNLNNFYLLGHSFGGSLSVAYCLKNQGKIKKLFLAGASCIRKKTFKKSFLLVFSKIFKPLSFIPLLKKAFYKFVVKSDYLSAKGFMKKTYLNIIKKDLSEELKNINVPTFIVWGEKDKITPLKQGEIINSKIKNSKMFVIKEVGHNLHREAPKEFLEKIISQIN